MTRRKKWSFLWILVPILIVGMLGYLFFHYFLDLAVYKKILEESLTKELHREVIIGKAKLSLWGGIGIAFEDFRVKDRSLAFDLLHSKWLILKIKILPLLRGEIKWKRIVLEQPAFHLLRDKDKQFNFLDGSLAVKRLKGSQRRIIQILLTLFGGSLVFRDGKISFSDESLDATPLITEIRSFNLDLSEISHQKPFPFRLSGEISHSKQEGRFSVAGTIRNIPEDMDLSKGKVDASVELKGLETSHFWPYLKALLPMEMVSGGFDLNAHYQGTFLGPFKASAKIRFKELLFDYPKVFAYVLRPKWIDIDLVIDYDSKDLKVPKISIELPELGVKAKGKIYDIGSEGMGIEAEAQSGLFDLAEGKKFIPFRIITPDVSEPLFRAEGSGPIQILSVKLSGKLPEIEHCDQLTHAHTLSIEVRADGTRLKPPWNLPPLEDLKGLLSFKNGHLNFGEVKGKVFHSVIDRASGTFYRLLLIPTLQLHAEGRIDLKDLRSLTMIEGLTEEISEVFSPIHILSGRADYRLSTKVVLKPPLRFQHQGSYRLSKVRFTHQQIPFPVLIGEGKIELSNEGLQWSGTKVEFGDSSFLMKGLWKKGKKENPFEFMAKGRGDLKNLFGLVHSRLFPEEMRLKLKWIEDVSGTVELSFKGKGDTDLKFSFYEGEVIPKGVNLLPKGIHSPFIFKEGTLSFSNLGVTFSKVRTQFARSSLRWDGSIKEGKVSLSAQGSFDFKHLNSLFRSSLSPEKIRSQMDGIQNLTGEAEVYLKLLGRIEEGLALLKEGEIRLQGFSLRHQRIPVPLSHIEGSLVLSSEKIRFTRLKGMLGTSPLTLSGTLSRNNLPETGGGKPAKAPGRHFSFQISSSQLDLDSLLPKGDESTPTSFKKLREWLSNWSFDGKVEVDQGTFRGQHYRKLKVGMKTVDRKLFLRPFQFKGLGGDLWGEGWIQPIEKGIEFEIKPRLSNMETKAFLRTLLQKGEEDEIAVSGRFHIDKVVLQAEGEDFQEVKKSLNGGLRLEIENGIIERGNILAKIFSILNVSQFFRGRLPDLKTKGLPFHRITATALIEDGVASTEDFLVDSDAMKITLLGKVDVAKNLIDAKIGVHPLVTLDMVLKNVPIAGYILTGEDKAFLSYVYEVKGDLNDPKIQAIPVKGMGENLWGIIQRLLKTPIRPFQKIPPNNKEKNGRS